MNIRNALVLLLQRLLNPLELRVMKLTPNKVRGLDPLRDLSCLIGHKRNPVIFDVGANDGETMQEFLRVFPAANLVAFEPHAACGEILERKFLQHPNVSVQKVALGAHTGSSELHLFSGNRMNSLLPFDHVPGNLMSQTFASTGTAEVRVETLDAFCSERGIASIDILKTDTQGYDLQVLKGAASLLENRQIKTILLEVNFVPMYEGQATFSELHEYLSAHGYRLVDFYNQLRNDGYTAWCDACYVAAR